jgi:hypothetical protein
MTHSPERILRELAAHQECQAEIRAHEWTPRPRPYNLSRTWSPTVMVGLLGAVLLAATGFLILLVSVVR